MDPDAIAKAFVEHYYSTFDANRSSLSNLCQDGSMLSFEGQKIQGSQNIVAKLTSLPFNQCHHSITTVDCQPSGVNARMLVFASGNFQLSGEQHAPKFSQGFFKEGLVMEPDAVAKAFVEHYYTTFDTNLSGLSNLYQEDSMLSFEGQKIQGSQNIIAKLTSLPFQQCHHSITTVDCQPSGVNAGMLVFVSGNLQLSGKQHALKFSQMFHLIPTPQGSYYVLNDIFRLNYA